MSDIIFFMLLGLGIGSLYAVLGAGLVVVYKGSGVINFAYGAMAMYGMATFHYAWQDGVLQLPWVDFLPTHTLNVPVEITLNSDGGWPLVPAFILAVAMAAFLGFVAHMLIFKPLKDAAPLGKVVASLGLALYLQGVALLNYGNSFPVPKSVVPDGTIDNFLGLDRQFPVNTLFAVLAAVVAGVGLWAVYRFTNFGLATRAAAGNEKGAILLGYSPQRLAVINWVTASVMATVAVIIVGPLSGAISPVGLTALIVPALAAALIGSLRSVPIAVAGGLALGMVQTLLDVKKDAWFDSGGLQYIQNGVRDAVPLLVIVAVLFLRGKSLPIRGAVEEKRLPLSPAPQRIVPHTIVWLTVITVASFFFEASGSRTIFAGAIQTMLVFAVIMLSMVVLTGYVGQISLAQMSLCGVAAFIMARMLSDGSPQGTNLVPVSGPGLPWPIAALIGIAAAVIVGLVLALPALRIRGVQLAVVTIAAAIAIQSLFLENEEITELRAGVPAFVGEPTLFGISMGSRSTRQLNERPAFAIFAGVVLALVAIAVANIRRTGTGRRFLAVRANERAAAAAGINIAKTKLQAFGISSAIAGAGGVLLAYKQVDVSSANFPYQISLAILAFAYLGGITSINGAMVAAALTASSLIPVGSNYFLRGQGLENYLNVLGGLGLIVTAIIHPEGIAPFFQAGMRHAGNWIVSAVPGAGALREAYQGPRHQVVGLAMAVGVVGLGAFTYFVDWTDSGFLRMMGVIVVAVVLTMILALIFGDGLSPSFGAAGEKWVGWAVRFGPAALVGLIAGSVIFPLMFDDISWIWMPLLGAGVGLFVRSIYRQIRYGHADLDAEPNVGPRAEPTLAEVG